MRPTGVPEENRVRLLLTIQRSLFEFRRDLMTLGAHDAARFLELAELVIHRTIEDGSEDAPTARPRKPQKG